MMWKSLSWFYLQYLIFMKLLNLAHWLFFLPPLFFSQFHNSFSHLILKLIPNTVFEYINYLNFLIFTFQILKDVNNCNIILRGHIAWVLQFSMVVIFLPLLILFSVSQLYSPSDFKIYPTIWINWLSKFPNFHVQISQG